MDFKTIRSGKDKVQILHSGYRMIWNRGPQGPQNITYFKCHRSDCKARLATTGLLSGQLSLRFHKTHLHTHSPDESSNIVAESLFNFRTQIKENPDIAAKSAYEEITTNALDAVDTPNKFDLAKKIPTYRQGKS